MTAIVDDHETAALELLDGFERPELDYLFAQLTTEYMLTKSPLFTSWLSSQLSQELALRTKLEPWTPLPSEMVEWRTKDVAQALMGVTFLLRSATSERIREFAENLLECVHAHTLVRLVNLMDYEDADTEDADDGETDG